MVFTGYNEIHDNCIYRGTNTCLTTAWSLSGQHPTTATGHLKKTFAENFHFWYLSKKFRNCFMSINGLSDVATLLQFCSSPTQTTALPNSLRRFQMIGGSYPPDRCYLERRVKMGSLHHFHFRSPPTSSEGAKMRGIWVKFCLTSAMMWWCSPHWNIVTMIYTQAWKYLPKAGKIFKDNICGFEVKFLQSVMI